MADTEWYYGKNGEERGPVSANQLRRLAQQGELAGDDLVWNESMSDWAAARQVKLLTGLFPPAAAPPAGLHVRDEDRSVSARAASKRAPSLPKLNLLSDFASLARGFGVPLLMGGMLLVVFSRGLDGIGTRGVERFKAKASAAEDQFKDLWDGKRLELEVRIAELRGVDDPSEVEQKRLQDLLEQQTDLLSEQRDAEVVAERELWRDLRIAARDAERNNAMWAYWRQALFVLGSLLLTCGLLSVGFHGSGPERLVCLIMLAIITFSLYVGGLGWNAGLGS